MRKSFSFSKQARDKNMFLSMQLIDYDTFHRLHLENLILDFQRLGLDDPSFTIAPNDQIGMGFLKTGRDIFHNFKSEETRTETLRNVLNLVHLERVVVHFLPDIELKSRSMQIIYRYKAFMGDDKQHHFEKINNVSFEDSLRSSDLKQLRVDLDFMLFSLTRSYINAPLRETARQNIWIYAFWMGLLQYFIFLICILFYDQLVTSDIPLSSLLVPFLGSIGACFAIKQKVEAMPETLDPYRNVIILNASLMSMLFGLFRGAASAIILNMVLVSQFIQGEIFPEYNKMVDPQPSGLNEAFAFLLHLDKFSAPEIAKILVWSLVAGYSERLIPDTIRKLSDAQSSSVDKINPQTIAIPPGTSSTNAEPSVAREMKTALPPKPAGE
jgi:hypothetical protein